MNINFDYSIVKPGYYPNGGGQIDLTIRPINGTIFPINLLKRNIIHTVQIECLMTNDEIKIKDLIKPLSKININKLCKSFGLIY